MYVMVKYAEGNEPVLIKTVGELLEHLKQFLPSAKINSYNDDIQAGYDGLWAHPNHPMHKGNLHFFITEDLRNDVEDDEDED